MPNSTVQPPSVLRISTIGMDQRARDALDLFFHNICRDSYLLVDDADADATIIDMDSIDAEQHRKIHLDKYPDRPTILISLLEIDHENAFFLKKPLQPGELKAVLEGIRENVISQANQATEEATVLPQRVSSVSAPTFSQTEAKTQKVTQNVDTPAPPSRSGEIIPLFPDVLVGEQATKLSPDTPPSELQDKRKEKAAFLYDPTNHLQGYIEKAYRLARERNRNVLLEGPWRPIIILSETREIWVEQSHAHLYALAVMPVHSEDVTVRLLEENEMPSEHDGSVQPLEAFLWKLAVRTARGRIPAGTDLRAPVSLRHWPNLSRLMPIRHGLRISALWTKQPVSLMETATLLDIAPKYIFSFYSAARALDLIEQCERNTGEKIPRTPSSQTQEHKGFLSKILARLRGRGR